MAAAAALAELNSALPPTANFDSATRFYDLIVKLRQGPEDELVELLRSAAERVSVAQCPLSAPPPAGRAPTAAELSASACALSALQCCITVERSITRSLSPAICEQLGSSATYRLLAACSWVFGEEAAAILCAGARAAQAGSSTAEIGSATWRHVLLNLQAVLSAAFTTLQIGLHQPGTAQQPPPYARAVRATLCKRERLVGLLDAAAEVLAAAEEAPGSLETCLYMVWEILPLFFEGLQSLFPDLPGSAPAHRALVRLAATRLAALWAKRPPEAASGAAAAQWLQRWSHCAAMLRWGRFAAGMPSRSRVQLLARLNGAAAWVLRQQQRGRAAVQPAGTGERSPAEVPRAIMAACCVALDLFELEAISPQELVLAAEAAGLVAAAHLAALERAAATGVEPAADDHHSLNLSLATLWALYEGMASRQLGGRAAQPDMRSVPGSVASLVGAAEAMIRLSAALAQQVQQSGGAAPATEQWQPEGASSRELASACCALGLDAAPFLVLSAAAPFRAEGVVLTVGSGVALSAIEHCAASAAKAARVLAALPAEQQAALRSWIPHNLGIPLLALAHQLAGFPCATVGLEQRRHCEALLAAAVETARSAQRLEPSVEPPAFERLRMASYFLLAIAALDGKVSRGTLESWGACNLVAHFSAAAVRCFPAVEQAPHLKLTYLAAHIVRLGGLVEEHPRDLWAWLGSAERLLILPAAPLLRSAVPAYVNSGLVGQLIGWAERAVRAPGPSLKLLPALQRLRGLLLCVLDAADEAAELEPSDPVSQATGRLIAWLEGLSKKQLRGRAVWEQLRRDMDAPLAECAARVAAAAAAEAAEPRQQEELQLQAAWLLAERPCANPACTSVRGASEARARGRRCLGCGVSRYCGPACQAAAWPEHGRVCAALRGI